MDHLERMGVSVGFVVYVTHWLSAKLGLFDATDQRFSLLKPQVLACIAIDVFAAGTARADADEETLEPRVVKVPGLEYDRESESAKEFGKLYLDTEASLVTRDTSHTSDGIMGPKPAKRFADDLAE